jgi:hypothetical protein
MSTFNSRVAVRSDFLSSVKSRRFRRFDLDCESLEFRQLLSMGQVGAAANPVLTQLIAQPALAVAPLAAPGTPTGLSPSQVRTAYGVNSILFGSTTGTGAGQTIAIVDAYYDPNISSDLATFDSEYKISAPPAFTQYVESGLTQDNSGWALETSLDVEWAHAIAPAANIVLVEAQPDLSDLFSAVTFASQLSGVSVVSMSWGTGEFSTEASYDSVFTTPSGHAGVTFVAASGDSSVVEYPSVSPNVLAVGGTNLNVTSTGAYISETGWSDSGGGNSAYESKPSWQTNGLSSKARTTPDVAFDAGVSTGVSVYDSVRDGGQAGWFTVGGTSVGAPSWSGLIAIADQGLALNKVGSLSNAQISLYKLPSSDFNAITTGSSGANKAGPGYDLVTGLGSPKANLLIPALVKLNTPVQATTSSSSGSAGSGSSESSGSGSHSAGSVSHQPSSKPMIVVADPTNGTTTITSTTSSSSSSTSTSTTSITPLNPNATSATTTSVVIPVFIVPPPLPPVVIHLGASASPVTLQAINSPLATLEEQPTSLTQFGQSLETELQKPFTARLAPEPDAPPWIGDVEPFQPLDPAEAPKAEPAPLAGPSRAWSSPLLVEPVAELTDRAWSPGALDAASAQANQHRINAASGFLALFGIAAVAAGGHHLAMRESERFRIRWLPRRAAADRSARPRIPAR